MEPAPYAHLTKGTFLIASPEVNSGIFFRSVIILCEHNPNGSFGLIINKNLDIELPQEILNLSELANPKISLRAGGPVQTNQMMLLHDSSTIPSQTLEVTSNVFLGGDLQFLQNVAEDQKGPDVRLFFGYAGWGPGALEREFLDGEWFLAPASHKHVFLTPADKVWQTVLREMGGKYATLSMIPEDLSLN